MKFARGWTHFPPEKYGLIMTGTSVTFLEGTTYRLKTWAFPSPRPLRHQPDDGELVQSSRMVAIAMVNLFTLLFWLGLWDGLAFDQAVDGFGIQRAFGISVYDTIHFAKYRQELNARLEHQEAVLCSRRRALA